MTATRLLRPQTLQEIAAFRQWLHRHPETGFTVGGTATAVAQRLRSAGLSVTEAVGGSGVVATLAGRPGGRAIGLRADMDALPITEAGDPAWRSSTDGRFHGCGHDGHTAMLLGAAKYLAESRNFDGTVHFIFQPAEEGEGGAKVMIEEGLFERFPVEAVFGMHNMPGIPTGTFAMRKGPIMAAADFFFITVRGEGAHGAFPQLGIDPVPIAAEIVMALQTIVARNIDPGKPAVVTVTQIHAGHGTNIIPAEATLCGTTRSFDAAVQATIEKRMREIVAGIAKAHGAKGEITYERRYMPTINTAEETDLAAAAAIEVVGAENVNRNVPEVMGAEDFGWMLNERPGAYIFIGNGKGASLHNPRYDFNDEALALGASYWSRLVEGILKAA